MIDNTNLHTSLRNRKDEFYTRYEDIEYEVLDYKAHFKDKIVYLNADDPRISNFYKFFIDNFHNFQLKELYSTFYKNEYTEGGSMFTRVYKDNDNNLLTEQVPIKVGNGDLRSDFCRSLLEKCDIVCTNPPFTYFKELIELLFLYEKKFLIIGHHNAISYGAVFPYIRDELMWFGKPFKTRCYFINKHYEVIPSTHKHKAGFLEVNGSIWYTNLENNLRFNAPYFTYTKDYNKDSYQVYDNYDAINCDSYKDIPDNYYGNIGVPVNALLKLNYNEFEIVDRYNNPIINGKLKYKRIGIRRRK